MRYLTITALMSVLLWAGCKSDPPTPPADTSSEVSPDTGGDTSPVDVGDDSITLDTGPDAGPDVQDAGPDAQDAGPDAQDAGPDVQDVGEDVPPPNACLPSGEGPAYKISARASLRWKRAKALQRDLAGALGLGVGSMCSEVGFEGICFGLLHLVPLGGNDPIVAAMYKPLAEPSVSTSLATDRVVVAACGRRVDMDTLMDPVVFKHIDLGLAEISPESPGLDAQTEDLYRRFLARDPTSAEKAHIRTLAEPLTLNGETSAVSARDFAKMACYAIATTTEFLFH